MTTAPLTHTDVIVLDYLSTLWAQSEDLAPELRDELMTTVADYIAFRRTSATDPIEDSAEIIRRLGPPADLVAAVRRGRTPTHLRLPALVAPPAAIGAAAGGGPEYAAIGLLTAGAFVLPLVGPVAGMLLATGSAHWTPAQKVAGWTLTAGSAIAGFVLTVFFAAVPLNTGLALLLIYLATGAGGLAAGASLLGSLRRRAG